MLLFKNKRQGCYITFDFFSCESNAANYNFLGKAGHVSPSKSLQILFARVTHAQFLHQFDYLFKSFVSIS